MKIIKFIFIFLIIVFILIIIGGIIFVKTFDANRYKPEIIRAAKTALARDVDFTELDLAASLADGIRSHF